MRITICLCAALALLASGSALNAQRGMSFRNEPYLAGGTADQVLDLDTPARPGFATIVFIHGGSLQENGERRNAPVYARVCEPNMPPTLVVLAEAERFFPAILEQGAKFARRLLEIKRPADVVIVPGRHYTSIGDLHKPDDPTFAAIQRFMANPAAAGQSSR